MRRAVFTTAAGITCMLASTSAQTITTTWADQSIIGVVTDDGNGYTWTAVISTLGPAIPGAPAAAATTPVAANVADAPAGVPTTPTTTFLADPTQSEPPAPSEAPASVTAMPSSGSVEGWGQYETSVVSALDGLKTQAWDSFTSAAHIQGVKIPYLDSGASSRPSSWVGSRWTFGGVLGCVALLAVAL